MPAVAVADLVSTGSAGSVVAISPQMRVMRDRLRADQPTLAHDWQAERRTAAIATWRSTPQGEGNQALFMLGSTLVRLGLPFNKVEALLRQEAVYARSPNERRQQIKAMLRKLKPSPFRAAA